MINKKFIFPVGGSDLKYAILGEKRVKMTKIPYYISNEGEYTPVLCWIRDQNAGRGMIIEKLSFPVGGSDMKYAISGQKRVNFDENSIFWVSYFERRRVNPCIVSKPQPECKERYD